MKFILAILTLIFIGISSSAQHQSMRTDFDTLQKYAGKTFVHFKTYRDSLVIEESEALLYPITLKIPRFRILRNIFKTEISVDSIVYHGVSTTYLNNRNYKTGNYENGVLLSETYCDPNGKEITENEYQENNTGRGPSGIIIGRYFFPGGKKEKK